MFQFFAQPGELPLGFFRNFFRRIDDLAIQDDPVNAAFLKGIAVGSEGGSIGAKRLLGRLVSDVVIPGDDVNGNRGVEGRGDALELGDQARWSSSQAATWSAMSSRAVSGVCM